MDIDVSDLRAEEQPPKTYGTNSATKVYRQRFFFENNDPMT